VSLPGADELFRTTGGAALQAPQPRQHTGGEAQPATPGDPRLRPVPDEPEDDSRGPGPQNHAPSQGEGPSQGRQQGQPQGQPQGPGRQDAEGAEHSGRDGGGSAPHGREGVRDGGAVSGAAAGPPTRRPISASAATPTMTATVTPQVPAQQNNVPPVNAAGQQPQPARRKAARQNRRPSGRERHDEKITVYVSAEELMDLEHARLVLRGEHGLAIDRGRIVREAVAVVLADLESRGDASILVRRLRGR
jgi:hypothetical protein